MTRLHPAPANKPCSTAFALRALLGLATLLFILAAAGCSRGSDTRTAGGGAAASTSEHDEDPASASGADPCALLEVSEVEATLGKLAGPPYRVGGDGPEAGGSSCMYEAASGRSIKLGAMWEGAAAMFKMLGKPAAMAEGAGMKGKLPLPDGATFEGDWDEAKTVGCCLLYAMLGDQMVNLDFAATHLNMQQAATLVNASLKRLDKPLPINGGSGVEAALARAAKKPKPVPVCGLLTLDEAQAILGPQTTAPTGSDTACTYAFTRMGLDGQPRTYPLELKVSWSGGYGTIREEAQMAGQIMGTLMGSAPKGEKAAEAIPGPWDEAAVTIDFMAVKKDVLMRIDLRIAPRDIAAKLVAKAMEKI
jgi:hypothetical protein